VSADVVRRNPQVAEAALRPWTPVFLHGDLQMVHVLDDGARPRRADDVPTGRGAELLVSQYLMRAATRMSAELVQRVGEQIVRSDDIVVPLENRELGGTWR
jgi:hypothetical protein